MNTPLIPKPNVDYFNQNDGQVYQFKAADPSGKGQIFVNKQTQEEQLLPDPMMQDVSQNNVQQPLKPIMKTQTLGVSMAHDQDIDQLVNGDPAAVDPVANTPGLPPSDGMPVQDADLFMDDIGDAMDDVEVEGRGVDGDIAELVDGQREPEGLNAGPAVLEDGSVVGDGGGSPVDAGPIPQADLTAAAPRFEASTVPGRPVIATPKRWPEIRKGLSMRGQLEFKERQLQHLKNAGLAHRAKDLGFEPDKRDPQPSGHSAQGIPIAGPPAEKDKQIGVTEFPKDQDRDASVGLDSGKGYNVPMKDMDEQHVADREKFDNEHRQYVSMMTIRQLRELLSGANGKEIASIERGRGVQPERQPVKPEKNDQYDVEKKAIALAVGLRQATAIEFGGDRNLGKFKNQLPADEDLPETAAKNEPLPKDAPVVHKPSQTAPKLEEYKEPGVISPASKEIKLFLNKFEQHYQQLYTLKDQLQSAVAPHQKSIVDEQTKRMPAITEQDTLMREALEMAYKAISATEDSIVHYHEELWAALSRTKAVAPAVTIPQIIAEAKLIDQHLAEQIQKLVAVVGERGKSKLRERFLYEFPPSKQHEKRMVPESSLQSTAGSLLDDLGEIIRGFLFIHSEIAEALKLFESAQPEVGDETR